MSQILKFQNKNKEKEKKDLKNFYYLILKNK